jgi:itaconyl-CoA hydratase/mesaconyl-C4 CoA hydratase
MNMDSASPQSWVGKQEIATDAIDPALVARIAATFETPVPAVGAALPDLWHWAFFNAPVGLSGLGRDGHPERGGFLPVAENRNRMWAGGRVRFAHGLKVGQPATRTSTVSKVVEKQGRTGSLLFVTVTHEYTQDGRVALSEEQDIVYREPSPPKLQGSEAAPESQWRRAVEPTAELLFRYSAVTFNTHRIHYDYPYVTEQEGYPGLVVHGPMIATLMLSAFAQANREARVREFDYRGARPLIAPKPFEVAGRIEAAGQAALWAEQDGSYAHRAEVRFDK